MLLRSRMGTNPPERRLVVGERDAIDGDHVEPHVDVPEVAAASHAASALTRLLMHLVSTAWRRCRKASESALTSQKTTCRHGKARGRYSPGSARSGERQLRSAISNPIDR